MIQFEDEDIFGNLYLKDENQLTKHYEQLYEDMKVVSQMSQLKEHVSKVRFNKKDYNTAELSTMINDQLKNLIIKKSDLVI